MWKSRGTKGHVTSNVFTYCIMSFNILDLMGLILRKQNVEICFGIDR